MFVYASGVEITASGTAETFTTKRLAASAPIPTTNTLLYTAPSKAVITSVVFCNSSSTASRVRMQTTTVYMLLDKVLQPNETFVFRPNLVLAPSDGFYAVCDTAGTTGLIVSGVEIT
jgi:hypothetical protein